MGDCVRVERSRDPVVMGEEVWGLRESSEVQGTCGDGKGSVVAVGERAAEREYGWSEGEKE